MAFHQTLSHQRSNQFNQLQHVSLFPCQSSKWPPSSPAFCNDFLLLPFKLQALPIPKDYSVFLYTKQLHIFDSTKRQLIPCKIWFPRLNLGSCTTLPESSNIQFIPVHHHKMLPFNIIRLHYIRYVTIASFDNNLRNVLYIFQTWVSIGHLIST